MRSSPVGQDLPRPDHDPSDAGVDGHHPGEIHHRAVGVAYDAGQGGHPVEPGAHVGIAGEGDDRVAAAGHRRVLTVAVIGRPSSYTRALRRYQGPEQRSRRVPS